ncbi:MAG: hypothetical protein AW07_00112 [Candidatus Accumulibacter sp. SK-11]|nr:MAG: hypothetical protein AW07_00112 [Candidatus Accumulibacter sp. SK-11]
MASVSGSEMTNTEPLPNSERISIDPFSFWMFVFTTSMPTPRPETAEAFAIVEKPGRKIRLRLCRSSSVFASSSLMMCFSTAFARIRSGLIPRPSSAIIRTM